MNLKKIALCFLAVGALALVSACNTMEGLGKDVKHVGQSVENAAAKKTGN